MSQKIELLELNINIDALTENSVEAFKTIKQLEDSQKSLKKSNSELQKEIKSYNALMKEATKSNDTKTYEELKKAQRELEKQYDENTSSIVKNQSALKVARKEYNVGLKLMDAYTEQQRQSLEIVTQTDGSVDQLSAALSKNRAVYKSLTEEEQENSEVGGKLLDLIKEQDEAYKKKQVSMGNNQVLVGTYEDSIRSATEGMGLFSGRADDMLSKFVELSQQEGGLKGFFQTFKGGVKGVTKAGLTFIATPIGAVIAAIVVGISLLTNTISRNQKNSDKFNEVWAGISNVIQELIARFFKFVGAVTKAYKAAFQFITLDFKGAKETATEAFDQMKESVSDLDDAFTGAYKSGSQLAKLQNEFEKATIGAISSQADLTKEIEKYTTIQDDATRSFKEREAAAAKVRQLDADKVKENILLAQQGYRIAKLNYEQAEKHDKVTNELYTKQQEAYSKLIGLQTEELKNDLANEKVRRELKQDRLERDLDILLDGYDNQKTINEKIIGDEKLTFEKRRALLNETKKLGEESFDKQIETLQQFTGQAINANALLSESNAEVLNQKIRELGLSEIIEGRLLEVVRDRKIATQDLADLQKELVEEQVQFSIGMAEKELDLHIAKNKSKIDSETVLTDSILAEEEKRLRSIYDKELAFLDQEKEAKLISEQDYQLRKLDLQSQYLEQEKALRDSYKEQKHEQEQIDFELDMELKALQGENEFELQRAQLEQKRLQEIANAEKTGADVNKINQKYALLDDKIVKAKNAARLNQYKEMFGNISELLGEQTIAGKAAGIAQATINTYQGVSEVWKAPTVLPEPFGTIAKVASSGLVLASGLKAVGVIKKVNANIPKAEHGAVFDIGGNRHSAGGTKFYGEDGTQFEAEKDEKLFILNRMASKAYAPFLSKINQMYGGIPLSRSTNYLAAGGAVSRVAGGSTSVNLKGMQIDYDLLAQKIGQHVVEGNKSLPNPVTDVKNIIEEVGKYNEVVDDASF